jgi:hypothetical protein
MTRLGLLLLGLAVAAAPLLAAQQAAPTFEVASIKPNRSGSESFSSQTLPDHTIFTNYKLNNVVAVAHQVRAENVLNAPE